MLIVANWKMNPDTAEEAGNIASAIKKNSKNFGKTKVVLCPPFTFLNEVSNIISGSKVYLGAKYIIVGHSEMRGNGYTDEIVEKKLLGAVEEGFKVILCVGEKERSEHGEQFEFIKSELHSALSNFPKKLIKNLVIAYEPIWAIGKSEAMKGEEIYEIIKINIFIKRVVSDILKIKDADDIKVLYGGSVTENNAKEITEKGKIDGLLIGRESLKVENFLELIKEI